MKQKTTRKVEEGHKSTPEGENTESEGRMWKLLKQIQQDQKDFFEFQKIKYEWEAKVFKNLEGSEMPPPFPDHILGGEGEEEEKEAEKTPMEKRKEKEPMKGKLKKTVSDPSASTTGIARKGPKMRFPKKAVEVTPSVAAKKKEAVMPKKDQKLKTVKERVEIVLEESSEEDEPEGSIKYYSSEDGDKLESEGESEEGNKENAMETSAVLSPKAAKGKSLVKERRTKRKFDNVRKSPRKSNRLRA